MVEFAILLLALVVTVSSFGLFFSIYLLLKRITQIPVDFKVPNIPMDAISTGSVRDTGDLYTPENADRTQSLEDFRPTTKKPIKVIYEDEDRITPADENGKE